jgi:hypothetical protein
LSHHAMHPHGTDGPSPIQKAAVGIGYSTIALHHHPASCLRHKHSKCAYPLFFGTARRQGRRACPALRDPQTLPAGERRTVLIEMAQVWQRLANEERLGRALLARLECLQHLDQVFHLPKPISHASRHCRGHFEGLMDAHKIVIHGVERERRTRGSRPSLRTHW